jgi:phosphodiesterase/alkaline phosphatase D-like protein
LSIVLGPIVGAVSQTSAKIWLKTESTAHFRVRCNDGAENRHQSEMVETGPEADFTGVAELRGLLPDEEYGFSVDVDGEEYESPNFRFRTAPKDAKGFWFVFGSCFRPCFRYTFVMQELHRRLTDPHPHLPRPSFIVLLGDQIYADQSNINPENPKWQAATFADYCKVYEDSWRFDQWFLRSLSQLPTFMIFDDHEVVNDWFKNSRMIAGLKDSVRSMSGEERLSNALKAYQIYQASRNPTPMPGFTFAYEFSWAKVFFFVIDARSLRRVSPP